MKKKRGLLLSVLAVVFLFSWPVYGWDADSAGINLDDVVMKAVEAQLGLTSYKYDMEMAITGNVSVEGKDNDITVKTHSSQSVSGDDFYIQNDAFGMTQELLYKEDMLFSRSSMLSSEWTAIPDAYKEIYLSPVSEDFFSRILNKMVANLDEYEEMLMTMDMPAVAYTLVAKDGGYYHKFVIMYDERFFEENFELMAAVLGDDFDLSFLHNLDLKATAVLYVNAQTGYFEMLTYDIALNINNPEIFELERLEMIVKFSCRFSEMNEDVFIPDPGIVNEPMDKGIQLYMDDIAL